MQATLIDGGKLHACPCTKKAQRVLQSADLVAIDFEIDLNGFSCAGCEFMLEIAATHKMVVLGEREGLLDCAAMFPGDVKRGLGSGETQIHRVLVAPAVVEEYRDIFDAMAENRCAK